MKLFFFSLFLISSTVSFSQTILSGEILDSTSHKAIDYAAVRLMNVKDSSTISGAYSDDKGRFEFILDKNGSYLLKISFAGYSPKIIGPINVKSQPAIFVGKIGLAQKSQLLQEVTVEADVELLKAGIDKKVYNVDQDLSSRGGGADDVLNNIPSVEVDQDGNVALRGDGNVTILIDGRPSSLTGGESNLLDAIPASSIERIEVVTNPSAKYDPDGTSGIINIVLKKNKLRGFNGNVSVTGATGHDDAASLALSYRNAKINVFGSYAFDYYRGYRNNYSTIDQYFSNDSVFTLNQSREGTDFKYGNSARLGFDYYINNQTTVGLFATGSKNYRARFGNQFNEILNGDEILFNKWERVSNDPSQAKNLDVNFHLDRNLKEDKGKWSFLLAESLGQNYTEGNYEQYYQFADPLGNYLPSQFQNIYNNSAIQVFTGQFDFERIVKKWKVRYEIGAKSIVTGETVNSSSDHYDYGVYDFIDDSLSLFDYNFEGTVNSVYGTFGQQLGKFKYQLGVRGEYATQNPKLSTTNQDLSKSYMNVYPSGHIRYEVKEKNEFSFSYSRRINRPRSGQLNPFTNYSDPYNLRMGNPDLNPEYIDSWDFGYSYTSKVININSSIYYRKTKDVMMRVKSFYENNTSAVTWENIDESQQTGLELVMGIRPTKWWRNTLSWNGNLIEYIENNPINDWNNSGFNWSLKYNGMLEFWNKTASLQFIGNFQAPRTTAQGTVNPWTYFDISLEKNFLNKKLSFVMRFSDVFNTKGFKLTVDRAQVYQYSEFKWLTRRIYLTVSYRFGKLDGTSKTGLKGDGAGFDF